MPGKPQGPAIVRDCPHGGRHQHGTPAAYKDDECRCDACRAACAADWRERSRLKAYGRFQPAWVSPVGAMRRLRALSAIGWCASQLGDESGLFKTHVQAIRAGRKGYLSVETDRVVRDLYDRLWDQAPPQRNRHEKGSYTRASRYAAAAGWVPPLAYIDEDIDNPDPEVDDMANKSAGLTRWTPFEERLWSRIAKTETCWLWTGGLDSKGYGERVGHLGRSVRPHRLVYEMLVGPIPDGLVIDHLCRVRNCVNPAHLEPVTALENTRRGTEARAVEDCRNGHPPVHRITLPSGTICGECRRLGDRRRDQRDRNRRRALARERHARKPFDEIAIERIMAGTLAVPRNAQSRERREAIRRLAAHGYSDSQIGERLGLTTAAVVSTRIRHDIPAGIPCTRAAS